MALVVKDSPANAGDRRLDFDPWVGKIPWRRKWQPTPIFLPGESHGQRSLAGYSPWGQKESDTTERLHLLTHLEWGVLYDEFNYGFFFPFFFSIALIKVKVLVAQLCLTLGNPMDCSLPGSSVHEILQSRILEWIAVPFSRGSSRPRDRTCILHLTCIGRWVLYH